MVRVLGNQLWQRSCSRYLKAEGFDAELVQEFVKTWAYQQRQLKSFDHVYTFASQLHTEDLYLQSGVNIIVTDSPMLLASHVRSAQATAVGE